MRRAFSRFPAKANTEWAKEWGISRERVRQIRQNMGFPPVSRSQQEERDRLREEQEAERQARLERLTDRECPVCGSPVPEVRITTCSSPCASKWRGNSKYRFRSASDRQHASS
jgi:hypothetical protein